VLHDSVEDPGAVSREHSRAQGAQVRFVYEHAIKGYAATLSEQGLRGVQRDPRVDYVEADGVVAILHHQCGHNKPQPYAGDCTGSGTVFGKVTDSNGAISGATVSIDGQGSTTTSDLGDYTISNVAVGTHTVNATADTYDPKSASVTVTDGGNHEVNFSLSKTSTGGGTGDCSNTVPWGVKKVGADVSSTKAGDCAGAISTVLVYVIDTGVDTSHTDLNVVGNLFNSAGGPNTDCNGHGTHVAGTMAAIDNPQDVVGVAPGAPVIGVKVLGCGGSGTWSGVIAGIDFVTEHHTSGAAVANMSLGGGANSAVDDAVRNSAADGILYSIAAGNDGANACNYSPARAGAGTNNGIITTAATNSDDKETSWSNYGSCVDIWAPGASILSTRKGGGTTTMSGTSMAAPHVGGGGALYLSSHPTASPANVESALKSAATATANKSKDGRTITREYVGGF